MKRWILFLVFIPVLGCGPTKTNPVEDYQEVVDEAVIPTQTGDKVQYYRSGDSIQFNLLDDDIPSAVIEAQVETDNEIAFRINVADPAAAFKVVPVEGFPSGSSFERDPDTPTTYYFRWNPRSDFLGPDEFARSFKATFKIELINPNPRLHNHFRMENMERNFLIRVVPKRSHKPQITEITKVPKSIGLDKTQSLQFTINDMNAQPKLPPSDHCDPAKHNVGDIEPLNCCNYIDDDQEPTQIGQSGHNWKYKVVINTERVTPSEIEGHEERPASCKISFSGKGGLSVAEPINFMIVNEELKAENAKKAEEAKEEETEKGDEQ